MYNPPSRPFDPTLGSIQAHVAARWPTPESLQTLNKSLRALPRPLAVRPRVMYLCARIKEAEHE